MVTQHRVLVVVGTRPEAIKLAPVVRALRQAAWCRVRVVATAQHRQLLDQSLAFLGLSFDRDLDVMRPEQTLADLTARLLTALDPVLVEEAPAIVVAQGDTTSVLAAALASVFRRVPFAHVEAGLRTGDFANPFPEEQNRVVVGRLASLHLAPTAGARQNLLDEGVDPARVHVTGNPGIDALLAAAAVVPPSPFRPAPGKHLLVVTAHRRENHGAPLARICAALRRLGERPDVEILLPVHPNPEVRRLATKALADCPAIRLVDPLPYPAMVAAMRECTLLLTDSGGVQEEAPSLRKPVLVLRAKTERPEGIAAGVARLVGTETEGIVLETSRLLDDPALRAAMTTVGNPYGDGRAAERIADAIRSFCAATR